MYVYIFQGQIIRGHVECTVEKERNTVGSISNFGKFRILIYKFKTIDKLQSNIITVTHIKIYIQLKGTIAGGFRPILYVWTPELYPSFFDTSFSNVWIYSKNSAYQRCPRHH